jgi:hypothetical protein
VMAPAHGQEILPQRRLAHPHGQNQFRGTPSGRDRDSGLASSPSRSRSRCTSIQLPNFAFSWASGVRPHPTPIDPARSFRRDPERHLERIKKTQTGFPRHASMTASARSSARRPSSQCSQSRSAQRLDIPADQASSSSESVQID